MQGGTKSFNFSISLGFTEIHGAAADDDHFFATIN